MPSLAKSIDLFDEARDDDANDAILASLDPLDPRRVSLDIFEVYCHEMIMTSSVGRRAYLIDKMRYMINRMIGHQYDFGRLYNRTCSANIVARVCARHAYTCEENEHIVGNQSYYISECLVDFDPKKWKKVIAQFVNLRENLLRNDASLTVLPSELDDENESIEGGQLPIPDADESINMALGCHVDFSKGYENVLDQLKFHACLSHLQPMLETAIQSGGGTESVVIPRENILAFESAIGQHFEEDDDSKCARILVDLLAPKRNKGRQLKSISEMKKIFSTHKHLFDLNVFQRKFLQLIRSWVQMVLPIPTLSQFNYGAVGSCDSGGAKKSNSVVDNKENMNLVSDKDKKEQSSTAVSSASVASPKRKQVSGKSPTNAAVEEPLCDSDDDEEDELKPAARGDLKRKRDALMKNVNDPLNDCVAAAQSARVVRGDDADEMSDVSRGRRQVRTPSFRKVKKSAHSLKFDDSGSEQSDEEEGMKLSEVPERYRTKSKPQEIQIGNLSLAKRRARFTEAEDNAIRQGVDRFGTGKWTDIKVHYAVELQNRSAVQLKDRWRTLNKERE